MRPNAIGGIVAGFVTFAVIAFGAEFMIGSVVCVDLWNTGLDGCGWRGLSTKNWPVWLAGLSVSMFAAVQTLKQQKRRILAQEPGIREAWHSQWQSELQAALISAAALAIVLWIAIPSNSIRHYEDDTEIYHPDRR